MLFAGFDFASLMKSPSDFHGASARTKNTKSSSMRFITGFTSVSVLAFGFMIGVICVVPLIRISVCGSPLRLAAT